jgi:hypothetical protein
MTTSPAPLPPSSSPVGEPAHKLARRVASFDPWHFGRVAIPPGLRREIIETKLPAIPPERLYAVVSRSSSRRAWRIILLGCTLAVLVAACAGWWASS